VLAWRLAAIPEWRAGALHQRL